MLRINDTVEDEFYNENHRFKLLCDNAPFGMVILNREGMITYANNKFIELFGPDTIDINKGIEWFIKIYPDPFYRYINSSGWVSDLKSFKPGKKVPFVKKFTYRNETERYINFMPVQLETGEVLIVCQDITKNKLTEKKIKQRNLELAVLNDIITSISSSLCMNDILETLKKVFIEKLDVPIGGVFLYALTGDNIKMETCWGIVSERMMEDFNTLAIKYFKDERIIKTQMVVVEPKSPYLLYYRSAAVRGFQCKWCNHLCLPLIIKNEVQGIIILIREALDEFPDDQLGFFKTLGQQIGIAIQNALLFERVRESHKQMQRLSSRLVEVQEEERRYLARELHDEVGQALTGLKFRLEMCSRLSDEDMKACLAESQALVSKLMAVVRELSFNLRPSMLDDLGLVPTLQWYCERFIEQTGIKVVFRHHGLYSRFSKDIETAIFRIVQEALTNIARYAKTREATVRLWTNEEMLWTQIEDHGVGFNPETIMKTASCGIRGMRERAESLGGRLLIDTKPGSGVKLTAEVPLKRDVPCTQSL